MKQLISHSLGMHRIQSASIAVSVALSVMIVVTFGLVYGGVQLGIQQSEAQSGADVMAIPADSMQYIDEAELLYTGAPAPVYMSEGIASQIASVEGVSQVSVQFYGQTLDSGCCSTTGTTRLIGIDTATDFVVRGLAGDAAVAALDEHTVIVGAGVGGVREGKLTIRGTEYTVAATMAETGTGFDASIIGDIATVRGISRNLDGYERYWEAQGDPDTLVSAVMVKLDEGAGDTALTAVKAKINLSGEAVPLVQSDIADKAASQLQSVFFLLLIAAAIMAAVTLLQLFARFYTSVWDRKSELALYRAIGASKAKLRALIAGEMGILVGIGIVIGIVLGLLAQSVLLSVLQDSLAFPYVALGPATTVALVIAVAAAFIVVGIVSIIMPLRQLERLDPSMAMQQGDID